MSFGFVTEDFEVMLKTEPMRNKVPDLFWHNTCRLRNRRYCISVGDFATGWGDSVGETMSLWYKATCSKIYEVNRAEAPSFTATISVVCSLTADVEPCWRL